MPISKRLNEETEIPDPDPYQIAPYNNKHKNKNPFVET